MDIIRTKKARERNAKVGPAVFRKKRRAWLFHFRWARAHRMAARVVFAGFRLSLLPCLHLYTLPHLQPNRPFLPFYFLFSLFLSDLKISPFFPVPFFKLFLYHLDFVLLSLLLVHPILPTNYQPTNFPSNINNYHLPLSFFFFFLSYQLLFFAATRMFFDFQKYCFAAFRSFLRSAIIYLFIYFTSVQVFRNISFLFHATIQTN